MSTKRDAGAAAFGNEMASRIRARMAYLGIDQRDLAARAGMTQPTLSRRLDGSSAFNTDELTLVCEALELDMSSLIADSTFAANPHTAP